ncbi:MAG TPA: rhodanese-like domain-containing protein [Ktedonobacterales bacterium]|nr:rhodanese-like domain-containing protein [Ktedonobacterales bacterium]
MFDRLFGGASKISSINPREAWERVSQKDSNAVLIDVREPWEYNSGHAKGAKNIPLSQLGRRLAEVPKNREILLICQSGNRSVSAAHFLQKQGLTQVVNVSGGTTVWRMRGLPLDGKTR